MGSRLLNFFANKWSNPSKNQIEAVDAEMSGVTTPVTMADSLSTRQESSPPTSPATGSASSIQQDVKMVDEVDNEGNGVLGIDGTPDIVEGGEEEEDVEGMDMKARALTKLLQTSSVSWNWQVALCELVYQFSNLRSVADVLFFVI